MDLIRIYFDIMYNVFSFFTIELFAQYQLKTYNSFNKKNCEFIT